jgi:hypothetical protein
MARRSLLVVLACLCVVTPAAACLWDYDTLQQERSRFPSTLELITGKFPRHSDEFYRWRIEDRQRRLEADALTFDEKLALYDDMAVAWDKLGQPEKAIELMQQKQQLRAGDYETLANLGTFHIHAGQLEVGAEFIRQAIEVNPDAHFGREIYQLKLVEYVLSRRNEDGTVPQPLNNKDSRHPEATFGFAKFVLGETHRWGPNAGRERDTALKGVLGMMRFGHYDSPILLEALGDLLAAGDMEGDARQLAARAYLRASQEAAAEDAAEAYRGMAEEAASNQFALNHARRSPGQSGDALPSELAVIEAELAAELDDAQQWIAAIHEQERRWIQPDSGVDPDAEFGKLYDEPPMVHTPNADQPLANWPASSAEWRQLAYGVLVVIAVTAVVATYVLLRWRHIRIGDHGSD